ncbi:MAG TPA: 16S rRNA (cytosine(1402)-N(4))-methyltransferase RsmH [Vicinamibacterales bacterium]|nr:16S rRNA (cytosine(1402)-N(4))-methyltransferase RsmH [Vicinamibacterales bacterium]
MHVPVLVEEVVALVAPERGGVFVDCTVGLGGHARVLLERGASRLIGFDRDPAALAIAATTLSSYGDRVELVHTDYRGLGDALVRRGVDKVDGILADLGVSSLQLDAEGRGFSFRRDDPLDMRMDTTQGETAADLLARVEESDLADVIYQFGEERDSRRIARLLIKAREEAPLTTTGRVADLVRRASRSKRGRDWQRIDPATRTFQALRIWVNRELEGLDTFLTAAVTRLATGGRLAVITFHSLEDRIVKHTFRALATPGGGDFGPLIPAPVRVLTKRPVTPGDVELAVNPRARSAKLRAVERV